MADDAARLLREEGENLLTRKLSSERHAAINVGAVRLKGSLCGVETDNANSLHECPLRAWDAQTSPASHMTRRGPRDSGPGKSKEKERSKIEIP